MPIFDVGLTAGAAVPFARQLPVFNWFYPFDLGAVRAPRLSAALAEVDWSAVRRRAAYVHVPFCDTVCSFCPFTRGRYHGADEVDEYVAALGREMELKSGFLGRLEVDSVFVGGGSPSVLTTDQIRRLGECIHTYFDTSRVAEFAVELEAKSVTRAKMQAFAEIGVNRVSFGVQTFSPALREAFSLDAPLSALARTAELANEFFPYTNVDMIYGIAGQSEDDVLGDADKAIALGTTTVDFYPLNNVAAQVRMHRALSRQGLRRLTAPERIGQRRTLSHHMRSRGYARINGYGYARRQQAKEVLVQHTPRFLYHDILYGYHDDAVVGYGASALTQVPGYNLYNAARRPEYVAILKDRHAVPATALWVGPSPEKGIVTFPYRGTLPKSRVPWDAVPDETRAALVQLAAAGLVTESATRFEVTELGWLFYVNAMYVLMPELGKAWISRRIAERIAQGRECEDTSLRDEE